MKVLRVAVTRAAGKAETVSERLRAIGASVLEVPLTRVQLLDQAPLERALLDVCEFKWVLLTSGHGVQFLADAVARLQLDTQIADCRFAIVGEATAQAAEAFGWRADVVPAQYRAEELLDAFASRSDLAGTRVLYPCAAAARDVLPDGLRILGADVTVVPCYESVSDAEGQRLLNGLIARGELDLVTVAAPSAVDALAIALLPERAGSVPIASIGPITTKAARQAGFSVVVEANPYTSEGLVRAIVAWRERTP